jgi:uncharacterized membrane protein YciS (DUF1049 family)
MKRGILLLLAILLIASLALPAAAYYEDYDYSYNDLDYDGASEDTSVTVLVCFAIGLVVALIVTGVMKGQLKSVRRQSYASQYVVQGSFCLQRSQDLFLYRNVTRIARPKDKK